MSNSCLFCSAKGAGVLTNEHVIPHWLLEYLGLPENDQLFQGVASSATETLVKQPRIQLPTLVAGIVLCRQSMFPIIDNQRRRGVKIIPIQGPRPSKTLSPHPIT